MTEINKLKEELDQWLMETTNELAEKITEDVKRKTPVRTGRARRGWEMIEADKPGDSAIIGNDVEYIHYLEDGTRWMAPVNMVKTSLDKAERGR